MHRCRNHPCKRSSRKFTEMCRSVSCACTCLVDVQDVNLLPAREWSITISLEEPK